MIVLMKFGPHFGVPDPSPLVMKLETYLRLSGIEHKTKSGDPRKAPKKKLPYILDEGKPLGDSQFVIEALKDKFGDKLDEGLSEREKAQHYVTRLAIENHTYFLAFSYRWVFEKNKGTMRDTFFAPMGFLGKFIFPLVAKQFKRDCWGQGILRHSWQEIDQMVQQDIKALVTLLGDQPFFGGDRPREIDCTTFAFIANMLVPELEGPFYRLARAEPKLIAYHNRMTEKVFPDYSETMLIVDAA